MLSTPSIWLRNGSFIVVFFSLPVCRAVGREQPLAARVVEFHNIRDGIALFRPGSGTPLRLTDQRG
jgi:hypothetical protein